MAWAASVTSRQTVNGRVVVKADASDDSTGRTASEEFSQSGDLADDVWLRDQIAKWLQRLAGADLAMTKIAPGPVTVPPPVKEDPVRAAYRADLALVRRYRSATDELGQVDPAKVQEYVDALARVRAGFGPAVLDLFG